MSRCRRTDAIAEIVADPGLGVEALTEDQWAHIGICGDCHATVRGLERLDNALAASLRSQRHEALPASVLATPALPRRRRDGPPVGPLLAAAAVIVLAVGVAAVGGRWLSTRDFGLGVDASPSTIASQRAAAPSPAPTGSGAPSPSPATTDEPTPAPTPGAEPGLIELAVGQVAAVVDEPLVVRTAPGTDPDSTITPDRLWIGQRVRILDGPADVDGYTWWEVEVGEIRGWVADAETDDSAPWLSPIANGRIWFWRHPAEGDRNDPELFSVRPDGSDEVRIGSPSASAIRLVISCGFMTGAAEWSHDGTAVVFDHSVGGCEQSVFSMRADGTELRKVGDGWGSTWRPDGDAIAFGPNGEYLTVPTVDSGRLLVAALNGRAEPIGHTEAGVTANAPSWSPDRSRIAFQRALVEDNSFADFTFEIWVMDADGANARRLAEGMSPTWAPDGRWIVYEVPADDIGTTELMRVPADGGESQSLGAGRSAVFSPDGRRLAVQRDGGVWTMAADGSDASLAIPASFVDGFAWSPDGGSLVVASDYPNGGAIGISIVRIDGAAPAVAGLVPEGHAPSWQPVLLDLPPAD